MPNFFAAGVLQSAAAGSLQQLSNGFDALIVARRKKRGATGKCTKKMTAELEFGSRGGSDKGVGRIQG